MNELYFEGNPFIPPIPVPAEQQEEILPLREMTARIVVKEIDNGSVSYIHVTAESLIYNLLKKELIS